MTRDLSQLFLPILTTEDRCEGAGFMEEQIVAILLESPAGAKTGQLTRVNNRAFYNYARNMIAACDW